MTRLRLPLLAATLLAGCHRYTTCTEIGCTGALTVTITGAPEGAIVGLVLDGEVVSCTVPATGNGTCEGDLTASLTRAEDAVAVVVGTGMTDGVPWEKVDVSVYQGEAILLEESQVTPDWSDPDYPNGEACDAPFGCYSAELSYTIAPG
jgi:hypothetical protein